MTARALFESAKAALVDTTYEEQLALRQEIYEWAVSEVPYRRGDRHHGYLVTLTSPVEDYAARSVLNALRCISGVIAVDPVPADVTAHMARRQVQHQLTEALWASFQRT